MLQRGQSLFSKPLSLVLCYQDLHAAAANRIEQQYKRLLADITATLQQERDRSLDDLLKVKDTTLKQTKAYVK